MAFSAKDLTVINGDARISDTHLQAVLGYGRINDQHVIIRQHEDELADFAEVVWRTAKKPPAGSGVSRQTSAKPPTGSKGGRPSVTCYLNDFQAALVCMFARTPNARSARRLIAEVFTAYHRGQLSDLPAPATVDPFAAMAGRAGHVANHLMHLNGMDDFALRVTHLPVWGNGRRPPWWANLDMRRFLTNAHRQMTLQEARDKAVQVFGTGVPSTSSIHRYWARLDLAIGPGRAA